MTSTPDVTAREAMLPPLATVGRNVPRVDAIDKVTGMGQYVADVKLTGMLHGSILRSPYPHARIVRIDTSRARAVPGVQATEVLRFPRQIGLIAANVEIGMLRHPGMVQGGMVGHEVEHQLEPALGHALP